mmetsp:Transcript_22908/g.38732  ORF Transcript_22908/g.38732 Transcript_22908/m.38732 type:complete len:369 (-) Transcript_22908:256-1362(-)
MAAIIRRALGGAPSLGLSVDDKTRLDEMLNLVDQATSDILISVDWSANMLLVDQVNATGNPVILCEVVRYLRKRVQHDDARVVMNALTLAETLVMNCHSLFHAEVATEKFMGSVARVARKNATGVDRESVEVGEKSLELIESWGEAFLPHRDRLPLFVGTYRDLKREGFHFPADSMHVPVFTPPPQSTPPETNTHDSALNDGAEEHAKIPDFLDFLDAETHEVPALMPVTGVAVPILPPPKGGTHVQSRDRGAPEETIATPIESDVLSMGATDICRPAAKQAGDLSSKSTVEGLDEEPLRAPVLVETGNPFEPLAMGQFDSNPLACSLNGPSNPFEGLSKVGALPAVPPGKEKPEANPRQEHFGDLRW